MVVTLENSDIQLEINPSLSRLSINGRQRMQPSLENVRMNLKYKRGLSTRSCLDRWPGTSISDKETLPSPHGPMQQVKVNIGSAKDDIHSQLIFALPENKPFLIWKLLFTNQTTQPIRIEEIELLSAGYIYRRRSSPNGKIYFPISSTPSTPGTKSESSTQNLVFFSNGWQSWSYSGSYRQSDHYRQTRLGFLRTPFTQNAGTPHPRRAGLFASDMFGVLGNLISRRGILAGFLSQREHFGSLETWIGGISPTLRLFANGDGARLDPGESMVTDWAYMEFLHLDNPDPFALFNQAVAKEHSLPPNTPSKPRHSPTGWCSWYQFSSEFDYTGELTGEDIHHNLIGLDQIKSDIPLEVIQIDDGFQSQIGDWFTFDPGFPDGPAQLANEIREKGFTPGIWLAPFIVHPNSQLAKSHREWLLKNRFGGRVNAGFNWNRFTTALDMSHPESLAYVKQVIHTAVHDWGFSYLKLDFLCAAANVGRFHDPTRTRAQVLRNALEAVRFAAGEDTFILGCSCPLGSAVGIVDAMRISPDTSRRWLPSFSGIELFIRKDPSLPSAFNAAHNSLTRAHLHQRWWVNDPDCLLLRESTHLTLAEVETIASVIALSGGSLLLSDHIPDLSPDRLNIAKQLLPLIEKRPFILDWFDNPTPRLVQVDLSGPAGKWHLLALFNWSDEAQDLTLNLGKCYVESIGEMFAREFWSGRTYLIPPDGQSPGKLELQNLPPHGVNLFALRPHHPHIPQYLGSDLHISQGLEVVHWQFDHKKLDLAIKRPGNTQGKIEITVPGPIKSALLNDLPISPRMVDQGRYILELDFYQQARIEIAYN